MASSKKNTEELATVPTTPTDLAVNEFGDDVNLGRGPTTKDDISIPFLNLLQSLSPQVQENNPDGARAGLFYNTVTRSLYTKPVVVPVFRERCFIEWVPRTEGGGFVSKYGEHDPVVVEAIKENRGSAIKLKLGPNDLVETVNFAVLILDETGQEYESFGLLGFTSTKLKAAKNWYTALLTTKDSNKRPQLLCYRSVLTSYLAKHKKGTSYNILVEPFNGCWFDSKKEKPDSIIYPSKNPELYAKAKELYEMFASGQAQVDYSKGRDDDAEGSDDEVAPF